MYYPNLVGSDSGSSPYINYQRDLPRKPNKRVGFVECQLVMNCDNTGPSPVAQYVHSLLQNVLITLRYAGEQALCSGVAVPYLQMIGARMHVRRYAVDSQIVYPLGVNDVAVTWIIPLADLRCPSYDGEIPANMLGDLVISGQLAVPTSVSLVNWRLNIYAYERPASDLFIPSRLNIKAIVAQDSVQTLSGGLLTDCYIIGSGGWSDNISLKRGDHSIIDAIPAQYLQTLESPDDPDYAIGGTYTGLSLSVYPIETQLPGYRVSEIREGNCVITDNSGAFPTVTILTLSRLSHSLTMITSRNPGNLPMVVKGAKGDAPDVANVSRHVRLHVPIKISSAMRTEGLREVAKTAGQLVSVAGNVPTGVKR